MCPCWESFMPWVEKKELSDSLSHRSICSEFLPVFCLGCHFQELCPTLVSMNITILTESRHPQKPALFLDILQHCEEVMKSTFIMLWYFSITITFPVVIFYTISLYSEDCWWEFTDYKFHNKGSSITLSNKLMGYHGYYECVCILEVKQMVIKRAYSKLANIASLNYGHQVFWSRSLVNTLLYSLYPLPGLWSFKIPELSFCIQLCCFHHLLHWKRTVLLSCPSLPWPLLPCLFLWSYGFPSSLVPSVVHVPASLGCLTNQTGN